MDAEIVLRGVPDVSLVEHLANFRVLQPHIRAEQRLFGMLKQH